MNFKKTIAGICALAMVGTCGVSVFAEDVTTTTTDVQDETTVTTVETEEMTDASAAMTEGTTTEESVTTGVTTEETTTETAVTEENVDVEDLKAEIIDALAFHVSGHNFKAETYWVPTAGNGDADVFLRVFDEFGNETDIKTILTKNKSSYTGKISDYLMVDSNKDILNITSISGTVSYEYKDGKFNVIYGETTTTTATDIIETTTTTTNTELSTIELSEGDTLKVKGTLSIVDVNEFARQYVLNLDTPITVVYKSGIKSGETEVIKSVNLPAIEYKDGDHLIVSGAVVFTAGSAINTIALNDVTATKIGDIKPDVPVEQTMTFTFAGHTFTAEKYYYMNDEVNGKLIALTINSESDMTNINRYSLFYGNDTESSKRDISSFVYVDGSVLVIDSPIMGKKNYTYDETSNKFVEFNGYSEEDKQKLIDKFIAAYGEPVYEPVFGDFNNDGEIDAYMQYYVGNSLNTYLVTMDDIKLIKEDYQGAGHIDDYMYFHYFETYDDVLQTLVEFRATLHIRNVAGYASAWLSIDKIESDGTMTSVLINGNESVSVLYDNFLENDGTLSSPEYLKDLTEEQVMSISSYLTLNENKATINIKYYNYDGENTGVGSTEYEYDKGTNQFIPVGSNKKESNNNSSIGSTSSKKNPAGTGSSPKTGENNVLPVALALTLVAGTAVVAGVKKKKK